MRALLLRGAVPRLGGHAGTAAHTVMWCRKRRQRRNTGKRTQVGYARVKPYSVRGKARQQ